MHRHLLRVTAATVVTAAPAFAQFTPTHQDRVVYAYSLNQSPFSTPVIATQHVAAPNFGPFSEVVQVGSTTGYGYATTFQDSAISPDSLMAEGHAHGAARCGSMGTDGVGEGRFTMVVHFDVYAATPAHITAALDTAVFGFVLMTYISEASVSLVRTGPGGSQVLATAAASYHGTQTAQVDQRLVLPPGSYRFSLLAHAHQVGVLRGLEQVWAGAEVSASLVADACYADCDDSGALTVADFGCFQTKFVPSPWARPGKASSASKRTSTTWVRSGGWRTARTR